MSKFMVQLPVTDVEVAKKLEIVQMGHQYWTCSRKGYELQSYSKLIVKALRSLMVKQKVFDATNAKTKLAPIHV